MLTHDPDGPNTEGMAWLAKAEQITNRSVTQVKSQPHGTRRPARAATSITRAFLYDTAVGFACYICISKQVNLLREAIILCYHFTVVRAM